MDVGSISSLVEASVSKLDCDRFLMMKLTVGTLMLRRFPSSFFGAKAKTSASLSMPWRAMWCGVSNSFSGDRILVTFGGGAWFGWCCLR